MEPFKIIFNKKSVQFMAQEIAKQTTKFDIKNFQKDINKELNKLELKDRVRLIALNLDKYLPYHFEKNCELLIKCLCTNISEPDENLEEDQKNGLNGFLIWPLTQYVEDYGLEHLEMSMKAMYEMTRRFSAEFAIRPFIEKYDKEVFKELTQWKKNNCHHIRRLVSEGTRPKLPWGMKVNSINQNLERNTRLIYSLRKDPVLYVRRSVANHLNDISYLDEDLFFKTINKMGNTDNENWVKRHATRSLLKKGHPKALEIHGYQTDLDLKVTSNVFPKQIKEGDKLELKVKLTKKNTEKNKVLIEYIIHYPKKNGKLSPKPFRLRDTYITDKLEMEKQIHFKKVTTRTHYPGVHFIEIQINGKLYSKKKFELIN